MVKHSWLSVMHDACATNVRVCIVVVAHISSHCAVMPRIYHAFHLLTLLLILHTSITL